MLKTLQDIFSTGTVEINENGERIPLHSNTSKDQGLFLQKIFTEIKPQNSLEVGFAYGISTLFILEMHQKVSDATGKHLVIEPIDWGPAALHNIEKEGLSKYLILKRDYSDRVLSELYHSDYKIQFAYIDTTKLFDKIMIDFYFIDKMLSVGGVVIFDDCGGGWPGVQRAVRFVNTMPHYQFHAGFEKLESSFKKKAAFSILKKAVKLLPFKIKAFSTFNFKTDEELGLDYNCVAFKKTGPDQRSWDFDAPF